MAKKKDDAKQEPSSKKKPKKETSSKVAKDEVLPHKETDIGTILLTAPEYKELRSANISAKRETAKEKNIGPKVTSPGMSSGYNAGKLFLSFSLLLTGLLLIGQGFNWYGPVTIHYVSLWPLIIFIIVLSFVSLPMGKARSGFSVAAVFILFLFTLGVILDRTNLVEVPMSGNITEEVRDTPAFSGIVFGGVGTVNVTLGDEYAVVLRADEDVIGEVRTSVKKGLLSIKYNSLFWNIFLFNESHVEADITLPSVTSIDFRGRGSLQSSGIRTDSLEVLLDGPGAITLKSINAEDFVAHIFGEGVMIVDGEVVRGLIYLSGDGIFNGKELISREAGVRLSGAGTVLIHALDEFNVAVNGPGSILYEGQPFITEDYVTGGGVIGSIGGE